MLDKEFMYYEKNKEDLNKKYNNKYIVIKNENIIGVYNSHEDAVKESIKTEELGTFLVQHCCKDEQILRFSSRVSFA